MSFRSYKTSGITLSRLTCRGWNAAHKVGENLEEVALLLRLAIQAMAVRRREPTNTSFFVRRVGTLLRTQEWSVGTLRTREFRNTQSPGLRFHTSLTEGGDRIGQFHKV